MQSFRLFDFTTFRILHFFVISLKFDTNRSKRVYYNNNGYENHIHRLTCISDTAHSLHIYIRATQGWELISIHVK